MLLTSSVTSCILMLLTEYINKVNCGCSKCLCRDAEREKINDFQAQEFTGADLYIIIRSMMPRGRNTKYSKKTQSLNAVKARTLRIILYQLTNRYRVHRSLDNECRRKGVTLLSWIVLCTARRKESRKKKCNQTSSRSIMNFGDEDFTGGQYNNCKYLYITHHPPTA